MKRLKLLSLIIILFFSATLSGEIMYVHTTSGTYSFDTSDIDFIDFAGLVSVEEFEKVFSKIPINLMQNYPNPFSSTNAKTTIKFELKKPGRTEVAIYNVKGQKVKTLLDEELIFGKHTLIWNGKDEDGTKVANGIYLYKVEQNKETKVKKMILIQ